MKWDSDHPHVMEVDLPKEEGIPMSIFSEEGRDTLHISTANTQINFYDCLNAQLKGQNEVTIRKSEADGQVNCPDESLLEDLIKEVEKIKDKGFLKFRDPDDAVRPLRNDL